MPGPYSEDLRLRVAKAVESGKATREAFKAYLRSQLGPTLKPGDIVICDNLPAHKVVKVQAPTVLQHCHALALLHGTGDHWALAGGFRPAEFREHGANGKQNVVVGKVVYCVRVRIGK
jgi:hypothetical protein